MVKDHRENEGENLLLSFLGLTFLMTARDLLYAPSNSHDYTYQGLCYTSCGALAAYNETKQNTEYLNQSHIQC